MLPYFILVFLPYSVYFFGLKRSKKIEKISICIFFVLFIIMLSLRNIKCGIDLKMYKYFFEYFSFNSFNTSNLYEKGEVLYYLLNKIVYMIGGNFQILLAIIALLSILPIAILYYKKVNNSLLTIALFLTVAPFSMYFSGLRQSIAMGTIVLGFKYIQEKKLLKYIIFVIIAMFFHKSAFLCLVLYPIYYLKITKKSLYVIIPFFCILYLLRNQVFLLILHIYNPIYENLYGTVSNTGQVTTFILLIIFCIYCFVFPDKKKIDIEFIGLRNFLLLSTFIQMFVPINVSVMRINYYILPFIPILIPKVKMICNEKNEQIVNLSIIIMTTFFIFYFFYNGYIGEDILNIFPYEPFWEG